MEQDLSRQATLNEILDSRERRAVKQKELLSQYGTPLVSFTMNIPGAGKDSPLIRAGFLLGLRRLLCAIDCDRIEEPADGPRVNGASADDPRVNGAPAGNVPEKDVPVNFLRAYSFPVTEKGALGDTLRLKHCEVHYFVTGPEAYLCVDMDATDLKKITLAIEEEDRLGRLFDMDVIAPGSADSENRPAALVASSKTDAENRTSPLVAPMSVSRSELGVPPRKCLLCDEPAKACRRSGIHTDEELQNAVVSILRDALSEELADLACAALRAEVDATPKPGLVDRYNNGSHKDMNYGTFMKSIEALRPYFTEAARLGMRGSGMNFSEEVLASSTGAPTARSAKDTAAGSVASAANTANTANTAAIRALSSTVAPDRTFQKLRALGKAAEQDMLAATGGVNTHKGAVFSMGLAVCAAARVLSGNAPAASTLSDPASDDIFRAFTSGAPAGTSGTCISSEISVSGNISALAERILDECARLTNGLCARDFAGITAENAVTAGEKLYARFGITGIRGQAEAGYPAVRFAGLPVFESVLRASAPTRDLASASAAEIPASIKAAETTASAIAKNAAACTALLAIMCHATDTNLIKRGGLEKAEEVTGRIRRLLYGETPAAHPDSNAVAEEKHHDSAHATPAAQLHVPTESELLLLDMDFIRDDLSPGGSADLLALTIFLHELGRHCDSI